MAQLSFKLPDDLKARLVAEAARIERPVSWLLVKGAEAVLRDGPRQELEAALPGSGVASEPRSGAQRVANGSDLATAAPGPAASPRTPAGTVEQMVAPSPSRPPASERAATMLGRGSPSPFTPPIPKKLNEAKGKKR